MGSTERSGLWAGNGTETTMATLASCTIAPDMRSYTSARVFDGVRQMDEKQSAQHRDRVRNALAKRRATEVPSKP